MAKEKSVTSMNDELLSMLDQNIDEIVKSTPKASRGKRSNWENLSNEQKMAIYKKMKINEKIAAEFQIGKRDTAQFFEISDVDGENGMTKTLARGQKVMFTKKGETIEDIVVGFVTSGSNQDVTFTNAEGKEIKFRVAGMSVRTAKNGDKVIGAVSVVEE